MRLGTVTEARHIDQSCGREPELLMEAAGALAADRIARRFAGPVSVVCGPGHNGADGLVIARHLHAGGRRVRVHVVPGRNSELFRQQLARLPVAPGPLALKGTVVDALFGTGLRGPLEGEARALVERLNAARVKRVAIDVPSGLDADRGIGPAVRADLTLTFGLAKPGFFVNEGPAHVGTLKVLNIGYPRAVVDRVATTHALFTARDVRLPARPVGANKTSFGHAVIVTGSPGLWGAGVLAADAAFRVGAGYVTWASFEAPTPMLKRLPEMMVARVDEARAWRKATAVCVGPGLGAGEATARLIEDLKRRRWPVVLDADGLNACAQFDLWPVPDTWILTPHAGELARILGRDARDIERDRFTAVRDACAKTGGITLLKGFRTVVGDGRRLRVIHAGNAALAKAGSGDALAGIITGFLAQKMDAFEAASLGAFVHGRVADDWVAEGLAPAAFRAGDIGERLPRTLAAFR